MRYPINAWGPEAEPEVPVVPAGPPATFTCEGCGARFTVFEASCGCPRDPFGPRPAVHFVGFRGDEYAAAVRVWGLPDFIHRNNDPRVTFGGEVGPYDTLVFARGAEARRHEHSFNDSAAKGIGE